MGWCVGRESERQTQGECPPAGKLFLEHQQALMRKMEVGRDGGERLPPRPDPQVHQVHVLPSKLPQTFCQWFPYYVVFFQPLVSFFTVSSCWAPSPLFMFSSCQVPKSMPHFKFLLQQLPLSGTTRLVSLVYSCITTSRAHSYVSQQFELNSAGQF